MFGYCFVYNNGGYSFLKKQKRKHQSEFEYWEEESYCPGVPVLPVGSFPFKVDKVSLEI